MDRLSDHEVKLLEVDLLNDKTLDPETSLKLVRDLIDARDDRESNPYWDDE